MNPYYQDEQMIIYNGDCISILKELPNESVNCCITSPPYWGLRDYGVDGQIGLEKTFDDYILKMVLLFQEVKRVLRGDGTLWLNLGDSYSGSGMGAANYPESAGEKQLSNHGSTTAKGRAGYLQYGLKPKDLVGIPWRVAFALQSDGWYLRQDIIWHKPNPMPESVNDRCTKAHEYIFLLAKSREYYYDADSIKEEASYNSHERVSRAMIGHKSIPNKEKNGIRPRKLADAGSGIKANKSFDEAMNKMPDIRNKRSVWTIGTKPYSEAHFATFPPDLIKPMILAGCPKYGTILDPFIGSGTTAMVSKELNRKCIGIELNEQYIELIMHRTQQEVLNL